MIHESQINGAEAPFAVDLDDSVETDRTVAIRCLTADEFFAAEPPAALVVPALGICAGPTTGIVGQAYVGKTIIAMSCGLSIALGKPLWGTWSVTQGPWL